jgi:nucleoside-diphosphate-sugar epimerase
MLARGQLTFFQWQARADSTKAQRELGFTPTPLEDGVRRTLEAMKLLGPPS